MSVQNDLMSLEKQFWTGDADFYRRNLDDKCLTVFAQEAGLQDKEAIAGMMKDGMKWRDIKLDQKGFVEPADGVALLSYHAAGKRETGEAYEANVTSGYVDRKSTRLNSSHT